MILRGTYGEPDLVERPMESGQELEGFWGEDLNLSTFGAIEEVEVSGWFWF